MTDSVQVTMQWYCQGEIAVLADQDCKTEAKSSRNHQCLGCFVKLPNAECVAMHANNARQQCLKCRHCLFAMLKNPSLSCLPSRTANCAFWFDQAYCKKLTAQGGRARYRPACYPAVSAPAADAGGSFAPNPQPAAASWHPLHVTSSSQHCTGD